MVWRWFGDCRKIYFLFFIFDKNQGQSTEDKEMEGNDKNN